MTRLERTLLYSLLLAIFMVLGFIFFARARAFWAAPLGPSMQLPAEEPTKRPVSTPKLNYLSTPAPTNTLIPGPPTLTPFVQATNGPRCGGPSSMLILAIGSDARAKNYIYGLADVIRLVRIDFITPRVSVLSFPRDLWVAIPDIEERYGITHEKLNQAYLYGNPGMAYYKGPGEGPGLLARTLLKNFGARPDRYLAVNMQTFVRLVDHLGGLDVRLPYDVDGRASDQTSREDLFFREGVHHISGKEALMLARIRKGKNADRNQHQSVILCALRDALVSPQNIGNLPGLADVFKDSVQTDLSPQEISNLACLLPALPPQNISFFSFPEGAYTAQRTFDPVFDKELFVYAPNYALMTTYTNAFQNGQLANPTPVIGNPPAPGTPQAAEQSFSCK